MNITRALHSRPTTTENRRAERNDRRADDRRSPQTVQSRVATPTKAKANEGQSRTEDRRNDDRRSGIDRRDRATVSQEARKPDSSHDAPFSSFLKNFQDSHSTSSDADTDTDTDTDASSAETAPSPEQERRQRIEETGQVLGRYSDFTNGDDEITSRDDYEKIAEGDRNGDFSEHLKEQNPDWSDAQIAAEVKSLQDNSRRLLDDRDISDHYDTGGKGGDTDGKIATSDLVAGRLRNDISKDLPPDLSVEDINELHEQNPGLGNEAITNKYYHQSQQLNELLGGDKDNFLATWPAFGSLASNSAGSVIRSDGVPGDDRVSDQVAEGNRKVFGDIAPRYDSYIKAAQDPNFDYKEWAKNEGFTEQDKYLQESFGFLEQARTTKDSDKKQEYLLASNVLAGRHEQGRLDPEIDGATAPVTGTGAERAVLETFVDKDPTFFMPNGQGEGDLDKLDVSQKIDGKAPTGLGQISDPAVRDALWRSLGKEGQAPSSLSGQSLIDSTGTEDWSVLDERMRTIAGLMVSGQRDPRLGEYVLDYNAPEGLKTTDHVKDLAEGVIEKTPIGIVTGWLS